MCFSHNCFSPVQGSKKTPTGFPIPPHNFSVFGSKVLAELPQSLIEKSPNAPRFHAAAFLYPSFGSMGVVVMARIRVGTEMIARTFIAKSIKLCLPIAISNDFGIFVQLVHERSGMPVEPVVDKPPESVLPEGQAPNLTCPRSGPPLKWIEDFGITQGCGACKKIEIYGSRQNSNHSKKCCRRYESWLKQQVEERQSRVENAQDESVLVPSGGEASGEAALSGEARAEIRRDLGELFSREFDVGEPEVSQSKRDGKDLDSAGAPGQDVLHEHDFHVGVLTYGCCCIKTLSRHQQLVSLSSMESELPALQHVAQEMSALQKVIGRILNTFQEVEVKEVPGVLYSDSESALKLLRNLDVPRKSRHLEIRIEWIKERVSLGQLSLIFRKGENIKPDNIGFRNRIIPAKVSQRRP